MTAGSLLRENAAAVLMAGSALAWYVGSYFASDALADDRPAPRARALGHWIPIALYSITAALAGESQLAVGVLFATSVAALALVVGIVIFTAEPNPSAEPGGFPVVASPQQEARNLPLLDPARQRRARRAWGFILSAAILTLIAGFRGTLEPIHAAVLFVQGLIVFSIWEDEIPFQPDAHPRHLPRRVIEFTLAALLAVIAAWGALRATRDLSNHLGIYSLLPLTSWLAAPALVLPMIGSGIHISRRWGVSHIVSTSVAVALLNLCLTLPVVIGIYHAVHSSESAQVATTAPATQSAPGQPPPSLPFPIPIWRVDVVMLILLGLYLLPMSFGRWSISRSDGAILVLGYLGYMWLTAWAGRS